MKLVKPRVRMIAKTELIPNEIKNWLEEQFDFKTHTYYRSEDLAVIAGKRCYRSFAPKLNPNITKVRSDSREFIYNILKSGHGSVLEHIQVTFGLEWISRVLTHELVRHRQGVAISQESLRYVRLEDLDFYMPGIIENNPEAESLFRKVILDAEAAQKALAVIFEIDKLKFDEKKRLTSCFRRIAPMGLCTGMVWSANLRAMRHILTERTSVHAEEEMRYLFNLIGQICLREFPMVFQDFTINEDGEYVPEFRKV